MHEKRASRKSVKNVIGRRDFLMGLGLTPLASSTNLNIKKGYNFNIINKNSRAKIRLGIIGFGFRGEQLARSLKFAHPDWIEEQKKAAEKDHRHIIFAEYEKLEDLDVELTAICDTFDIRVGRGIKSGGKQTSGYKHYEELLSDRNVDAVIIATPDHWHAQMAIDAAKAGKHIYLEKCMTRTPEEAVLLRNVIKEHDIIFQLGHQGRQNDTLRKARDLIEKGTLGKISLIETTTNRNNAFGAWVWPIHEKGNANTIDWKLFQGPVENKVPFNPERFFRWRCWYDYGTGMSGDLLTHEYDAINSILNVGIPDSAIASGGIYHYNDGRDVPDVFQANYEYAQNKLSLLYSGTLANSIPRGTLIMGSDATLELGKALTVWADAQSTKYKNRIESGIIDPNKPIVNYNLENLELDALTSATSKYFADRGLMYTYQDGRRYDTTHLHLAEWLHCIRKGGVPSCNIDHGYQEAITAHMATASYRNNAKVFWDFEHEKIVIH
jgi:predicted dehydrogenase